jgi:membrane-associated phospholipid phosphatase
MRRSAAIAISVIMHPLLMLTYITGILFLVNPYLFTFNGHEKRTHLLSLFMTSFMLPTIAILMLKWLDMVKTYTLYNREERIGPFIICFIFYFWIYLSISRNNELPVAMSFFALGSLIGLGVTFVINLFFKVSLHAMGSSGLVIMIAFVMWLFADTNFSLRHLGLDWKASTTVLLYLSVIMAGLTGWARLYLNAHTPRELYVGYAVGFFSQLVAYKIVSW